MEITKEQFERVEKFLPKQRGNVEINNRDFINALIYMNENGCKWRSLPEKYGKWYSVHKRCARWAESGILAKVFMELKNVLQIEVEIVAIDSTCAKVHPDGTGALKKKVNKLLVKQKADGTPKFMWLPPLTVLP